MLRNYKKLNKRARISLLSILFITLVWLIQSNYQLIINRSKSLSITAVIIKKGALPTNPDQIFAFRVKNNPHYKMQNMIFIKLLGGLPGDAIEIEDKKVYVRGHLIGIIKETSSKGLPLSPIKEGIIPNNQFFVYTPHKDSFDSRYQDLGLVHEKDIIGTAIVAF